MNFREKVKRVFRSKSDGRPKVEYYRRHECPPSKFRGPFDREHQKRLAAWSFDAATADRPRSLDLSLSPCATNCPAPDVLLEESGTHGRAHTQEDTSGTFSIPPLIVNPSNILFCSLRLRCPRIIAPCNRLRLPVLYYSQPLQLQRLNDDPPQ